MIGSGGAAGGAAGGASGGAAGGASGGAAGGAAGAAAGGVPGLAGQDYYSYYGQLPAKPQNDFIPRTADFSGFGR